MKVLLQFRADVNARDYRNRTALHLVVGQPSAPESITTIKLLLSSGIDVDALDWERFTAIQAAIRSTDYEWLLAFLEGNVEVFPRDSYYDSIEAECHEEDGTEIGRLVDASIKLEVAGLSCTRHNLTKLAHNPREDYFSIIEIDERIVECEFGKRKSELEFESAAEVKRLKKHQLICTMSLHDFLLTNEGNLHCIFNGSLLDDLRSIDYGLYPVYENLLRAKFEWLKLIVSAMERFGALMRSDRTNGRSLPEELLAKILVHQDNDDLQNLISCSSSSRGE